MQPGRIDEVIELEAGNTIHQIRVVERGFSDTQGTSYNGCNVKSNGAKEQAISSYSDSSSEVDRNPSPDGDVNAETKENETALNAVFTGKENNDFGGGIELVSKSHPGDKEPGGCNTWGDTLEEPTPDIYGENKISEKAISGKPEIFKSNLAEVEACGTISTVGTLEGKTKVTGSFGIDEKKDGPGIDINLELGVHTKDLPAWVAKDIMGMGFNKKDITCLSPENRVLTKSVWEARVDDQNKSTNNTIEEGIVSGFVNSGSTLAREEEEVFFPEKKSVKQGN
ncbi:hypothetical protein V6N13_014924 [Hibiscus sabdariffa]